MKKTLLVLSLLSAANVAYADDLPVQVTRAWARPTIGDNKETAIYFEIKNTGSIPVTLTGVTSPAGHAMMHESTERDGIMRMEPLGKQQIKPGSRLSFSPGHHHVMLDALKQPLKAGDHVLLTLYFSDGKSATLSVPVTNGANDSSNAP